MNAATIKKRSTAIMMPTYIICDVVDSFTSSRGAALKVEFNDGESKTKLIEHTLNRREKCWFWDIIVLFVAHVPLAATEVKILFSRFAFGHAFSFVVAVVVVDETTL